MRHILSIFLLATTLSSFGQDKSEQVVVDSFMKRFYQKLDTVSWLCDYDNIAWWTSDSVSASPKEEKEKLGSEWFCFEDNNLWHATYGKYQNDRFEMVYHYTVDTNHVIRRIYSQIDTALTNSFSRALIRASNLKSLYPDTIRVRCNQYIRKNKDNSISVWLLPAFTTNGIAVYGGEFYYHFDETGNNLVYKSEYSQKYRGFKPDKKKQIELDYSTVNEPTLGAIFFVWYYRTYFDRIIINARKFRSSVFHDDEKGYYWVHAVNE